MANQKQDDQLEQTYSSYVMMRDVTLKTCQRRWMIGRCGERGSGISVLAARHDDEDDDTFPNGISPKVNVKAFLLVYIVWQLHKNATWNLKQVLAATPHKTPTVRPPAPYHENYSS